MSIRAGLMALALASAACDIKVDEKGVSLDISEGRATDVWTRTYTIAKDGRVELENANGDIQVVPSAGAQVEIRGERRVQARSDEAAAEILAGLKVEEQVTAGLVRVAAPRGGRSGFLENVRVDYRISVPPGTATTVRTQNGAVRLENVEGQVRAFSTTGSIEGRRLAGTLEASTVNGGITAEFAKVTGEVRLSTVNGGIRVELPADIDAMLDASTVNGGIRLDQRLTLAGGDRDRKRVSGRLNDGGPAISIQTTNGGIRLGVQGSGEPVTIEETRSP